MSYEALEESQQDAQPVLLFQFVQGTQAWYYWAGSVPFTYGGHTYLSEPLLPGNIANTGDVPKDTVALKLPITNPLAASYLAYAPDAVTTVTIFRLHYDDSEALFYWKGRILSYSASVGVLTFTCESAFSSLRRIGLRQTYQRLCRHVLGGPGCNVPIENYKSNYIVASLNGAQVTLTATLQADYTGGTLLAPDGTRRMIVSVGSNSVVLMRPIKSLADNLAAHPSGFTVTLYQGCDRSTAMCHSRFVNLGNFGGFPGIPWINPMTNISSVF